MARPNWFGIGKTVNQHGEERVYGGARKEYGSILNNQPSGQLKQSSADSLGSSQGVSAVPVSRDCVDAITFALVPDDVGANAKQFTKHTEEAKMTLFGNREVSRRRSKPAIELEVDQCGRYHFATAFVYVEERTKHKGTLHSQIVGYGVARRQHGDPKDDYVGEGLAVSRALEDVGYKLAKRALGRVKHNDDVKVMRRQQKRSRQAKAKNERSVYDRFVDSMPRIGKVTRDQS